MSRKEAKNSGPASTGRKAISLIAVAMLAIGSCVLARWCWGPEEANANPPAPQQRTRPVTGRVSSDTQATTSRPVPRTQTATPANRAPSKVAAMVNGQQITRQQLGQECLKRYGTEVLESIVNKHLIWQECEKKGIQITDQDVEAEINRMAGKFGLSADRWLTMLAEERDIMPNQYRREIVWPTLALRKLAAASIQVTPQELQEAFENEYGAKVKVRLIATSTEKKAQEVYQLAAANPGEFSRIAREHSEDASASVQGMIPPIRRHMGVPEIEQAAFRLKPGEVSPIIKAANQFIILKCEKQIPATYVADKFRKDAENRLADRIRDQKLRESAGNLFQRLQKESNVVNVYNDPAKRQQQPGVAALINGKQIPIHQLAEECIIRYGEQVLDGEINRVLLTQALQKAGRQVQDADIQAEVARAADSYGYLKPDGSPDVQKWLEKITEEDNATVELYVQDAVWPTVALKKLVQTQVQVKPEDLQRAFESNYGPRVEALAIVFNNQRQAQRVWEMARSNPTDQFFGELANQYSVDPISRENMGQVPPIRKYGGQPLLESEAFRLKAGEMSGIIGIGDQFIVIRSQGQTKPIVTEMDEEIQTLLSKEIHEQKLRKSMTAEFDKLMAAAQIQNFLSGEVRLGKQGTVRR